MFLNIIRGVNQVRISESTETGIDLAKYVSNGSLQIVVEVDYGVLIKGGAYSYAYRDGIYSSVTVNPLLSFARIVINGEINGANGTGGIGGDNHPGDGGQGGSAISLACPITINVASGKLIGGGGGGGGGQKGPYGGATGGGPGGGWPRGWPRDQIEVAAGESKYGYAAGGIGGIEGGEQGASGGACYGTGVAGQNGFAHPFTSSVGPPGTGGAIGWGVNSHGQGVTVLAGSDNIIGGIDL